MSLQLRKTRKYKTYKGGSGIPGSVPSTSQGGPSWLPVTVPERAATLKGKGPRKPKASVNDATGVPLVLLNNWKKFAEQAIKPIIAPQVDPGENNFDHPFHLQTWFENNSNRYKFFYGIGVILKYKEDAMGKKISSIVLELEKLTDEYKINETNYEKLVETSSPEEMSEMKESMQEKVRENLNVSYQSRYSELVQKKQSYDTVLKSIANRRWFLVYSLQNDQGEAIIDNIMKAANNIYSFYRGKKYKSIRELLYKHILIISNSPSAYQNSFMLNTSIVGPAGSGKTTLAREMAKWYAKLGILTYDAFFEDKEDKLCFVETGRSGLIAEYTGQTAPKTLGVLVRSLEKTLFIDEAYSVPGCAFDANDKLEPDAYGEEFLAELLRFMNDHKGFTSLIVAGYENLMLKCFFSRNEGLPRRFPQQIVLPFYSTDELFGIFARSVVSKSLNDISVLISEKENTLSKVEKQLRIPGASNLESLGKQQLSLKSELDKHKATRSAIRINKHKFICVAKPSFMMIHNDTTYDGINLLRKYLSTIKIRIDQNNTDEPKDLTKIYSYTILNQVLTNLLEDDKDTVRRQLLRRMFYRDVFSISESNLSFFPAQAGEMENLADDYSKNETSFIPDRNVLSVKDELNLLNAYCQGKKIKLTLSAPGQPLLPENTNDLKTQEDSIKEEISSLYEEQTELVRKRKDFHLSAANFEIANPDTYSRTAEIKKELAKLAKQLEKIQAKRAAPETTAVQASNAKPITYYELYLTSATVVEIQSRIRDFLKLNTLFPGSIPSLTELWTKLNDKAERDKMISHMVDLYMEKATANYVGSLLNLSEKTYPIHLEKKKLEVEYNFLRQKPAEIESLEPADPELTKWNDRISNLKAELQKTAESWAFPSDSGFANKDMTLFIKKQNELAAIKDPKRLKIEQNNLNIIKEDIVYEDFGISYK